MKFIVLAVFVLFAVVQGKDLPDSLAKLVCQRSVPDFNKCILKNLRAAGPAIFNGIPELNLPPLDPLELPLMTVDRTINDLVSIKSVLRNVKMTGFRDAVLESLKTNPKDISAELRYTLPWTHLEMEYDVEGQLLTLPLRSKGFFSGNFTDTKMYLKGSLKYVENNGVKYFRVEKLYVKARVGDGEVKLIAADPEMQYAADLIANFYNAQPQLVMDAINPIFVESTTDLFRAVLDQVLGSVPAKQLLPE